MKNNDFREIDGRRFYYVFLAGANKIIENQIYLNKINYFPVPDGDTGTNMASMVQAIMENVRPRSSYKEMTLLIAESALMYARGNSGIIFAQFLQGLSSESSENHSITLDDFAENLRNTVSYVYQAIAEPVEGTMITIIKKWADFVYKNKTEFRDFKELLVRSGSILKEALEETKSTLAVLRKANVVDAGANAFVYFIEGMLDFVKNGNVRQVIRLRGDVHTFQEHSGQLPEKLQYRYCTEAILKDLKQAPNQIMELLQKSGDSVVVAGAQKSTRIHVHTNDPGHLFQQLESFGRISFQKADDMLRQSEAVHNRKWNIALLTDSACDLPVKLLDHYQVHLLPMNIYFGENHYLDKISMKPEQFYQQLDQNPHFPKSAQVNELAFQNMYSHLATHYDAVIAVHITSRFSGTFSNSQKAAKKVSDEIGKPIEVIDSRTLSGAQGMLVLRIAEAIAEQQPFGEIVHKAKEWTNKTRIYVSVKTLKYMVRGGRVSPMKGRIARIMNVKPIVSMDSEGGSVVFGKAYSQKASMHKLIRHVAKISQSNKIWKYIILHAANPDDAHWFGEKMFELTGAESVDTVNISPVIGANAGRGAASVALMFE